MNTSTCCFIFKISLTFKSNAYTESDYSTIGWGDRKWQRLLQEYEEHLVIASATWVPIKEVFLFLEL